MLLASFNFKANMDDSCENIILLHLFNSPHLNTIRKLNTVSRLTEREAEISAGLLLTKEYIITDGFLNPNSILIITESGIDKANELIKEHGEFKKALHAQKNGVKLIEKIAAKELLIEKGKMKESHQWIAIRSYGNPNTSSGMLRTNLFPMGGRCKNCGTTTQLFKHKPDYCPKQNANHK